MPRGQKLSDSRRGEVVAVYGGCGSVRETARRTGVAKSTVFDIVHGYGTNEAAEVACIPEVVSVPELYDEIERVHPDRRMEFAQAAGEIAQKGLRLLELKIEEGLIDPSIRAQIPLSQLTTAVATLYEKGTLARGDNAQNTPFEVKIRVVDG